MRTIRRLLAVLVLAAAAAAGGYLLTRKQSTTSAVAPAPALKTVAVAAGDLTTTEKIDGTVEVATTLTVLHRIAGQTSIASTAAPATATPTTAAAAATRSAGNATGGTGAAGTAPGASTTAGLATGTPALRTSTLLTGPTGVRTGDTLACPPPGAPTTTATITDPPTTLESIPGCAVPTTSTTSPASTTTAPTADPSSTTAPTPTATSVAGLPSNPGSTTTVAPGAPAGGPASPGGPTSTDVAATATTNVNGGRRPTGGVGSGTPTGSSTGATGRTSGTSSTASSMRTTQTVTSVIRVGASVGLGDVLYTVDSQPVVALSGALPAWRTMSTSSANGPDIQQLETSLVSLGYDPAGTVTVDGHFDSRTKAMVERWQTGLGIKATGIVTLGSIVFLPSADPATDPTGIAVSAVSTVVGAAVGDGDPIVTLTTNTQDVVIDVPNGDEAFVVPGLAVQIGTTTGTVSLLRSANRNGTVIVEAVITPDAPIPDASNGATVKVTITTDNVPGVLIVPAEALLSRLDGSYVVQVQASDGTITWHAVALLGVSGNKVGIRGDGLAEGTLVLVPA